MGATTVLVIEDDFEIRESLVDLLLEDGFDAVSAKDGRDAMEELRMHPDVGLILLDLNMPMMDGPAFRAEQLADPALAAIPIVVLSANQDCAQTAAILGAHASLQKPFAADALRATLDNFL